jgi:hypothetical protein
LDKTTAEEAEMMRFNVPLSSMRELCNPLTGEEWDCAPIDPALVLDAAEHQEFEEQDWQTVNRKNRGQSFDHFNVHVRRMAFLYVNPDDTPIELEIDRWENRVRLRVYDGNHRLGSAIIRGDEHIVATIPSGDIEAFLAVMPSAIPVEAVEASWGP